MQKILIMGLPGAGKTYFAERLKKYIEENSVSYQMPLNALVSYELPPTNWHATVKWFNADEIRRSYNDWDFSKEGRIRQSIRMFEFAMKSNSDFVICDFVAPLHVMRNNFKADWTIWIDTINEGRYEYNLPDDTFDVVASCEMFEHDQYWAKSFKNMIRLCRKQGLIFFTCATTGRKVHGTLYNNPHDSPNTVDLGWDYYKNLTEEDFRKEFDFDNLFEKFEFTIDNSNYDLYFYAIKR